MDLEFEAERLAHEFMLGFREAANCPDVSLAEYEAVMARRLKVWALGINNAKIQEAARKGFYEGNR